MGARRMARAAWCALLLAVAARAEAGTVVEPIARLSLEGGYDSNALQAGEGGDRVGRVSPDVGVLARDHTWNLRLTYGGDWVTYQERQSEGVWNHRAGFAFATRASRRLHLDAVAAVQQAYDPVGLAALGIFREGQDDVFQVNGRARGEWRATRRLDVAMTSNERVVLFDDGTGGAMHALGGELLLRQSRDLRYGAGYGISVFQDFRDERDVTSQAHALKARADLRLGRYVRVLGSAGTAIWLSPDTNGIVPEASLELLRSTRESDLRVVVWHGLGIGSTARPSLLDSVEVGAERRFGYRYVVRGDAGLWHSGRAPSGDDATLGYAASGEAALRFRNGLRFAVFATRYARVDERSPELERSTVGLRMAWELLTR